MDGAIKVGWAEHSQRLGGLFNVSFIPQIALVLGRDEAHWHALWRLTCDPKWISEQVRNPYGGADFSDVADAYLLAALLRGLYHDYLARDSGGQIIHHPFRAPVLTPLRNTSAVDFSVHNTERFLATITIASAFAEKSMERRIELWASNVHNAHKAFVEGSMDLDPKDYEDVALEVSLRNAKVARIRGYGKWLDAVLRLGEALGVGVLTSFVLNRWAAAAAGVGAQALSDHFGGIGSAANRIFTRESRLRQLAQAGPGRIIRVWQRGDVRRTTPTTPPTVQ